MEALLSVLQKVTSMQWSDYLDIVLVAYLIYRILPQPYLLSAKVDIKEG